MQREQTKTKAAPRRRRKSKAQSEARWPADKVERWPLSKLAPYATNPKGHSAEQVTQIVASIKEFGWTIPVLVDEHGEVIAGHGRVLAAQEAQLTEVPVMVATGWTQEQKQAYRIADNKLTENGLWDDALLAEELSALLGSGFDLSLTGFDAEEVDVLMHGWESDINLHAKAKGTDAAAEGRLQVMFPEPAREDVRKSLTEWVEACGIEGVHLASGSGRGV